MPQTTMYKGFEARDVNRLNLFAILLSRMETATRQKFVIVFVRF